MRLTRYERIMAFILALCTLWALWAMREALSYRNPRSLPSDDIRRIYP